MTGSASFQYLKDTDVVHLLAFIGGFYDTAGYLLLNGVFTSSITGNLVVACASVYNLEGVICRGLVCVTFIVIGFICTTICLNLRFVQNFNPRLVSLILFSFEFFFILTAWVFGLYYKDNIDSVDSIDKYEIVFLGCLMGGAMGAHNVAAKETIPNCPATTVMTSTLINVGSNASNTLCYWLAYKSFPKSPTDPDSKSDALLINEQMSSKRKALREKFLDFRSKLFITAKPLVSFIVGAVIGAAIASYGSFWFNAVPAAIVLVIMFNIYVKDIYVKAEENTQVVGVGQV